MWDKELTQPVLGLSPFVGISFPDSSSTCPPLCCLSMCQWPSGISSAFNCQTIGEEERSFCCSMTEVHIGQLPCVGCRGHPLATRDQCTLLELFLLCIFSMRKALLRLVLDHVVFSLVAPIPRFSEQSVWLLSPLAGGMMVFVIINIVGVLHWHWLTVQCYLTIAEEGHSNFNTTPIASPTPSLSPVTEEDICVPHETL